MMCGSTCDVLQDKAAAYAEPALSKGKQYLVPKSLPELFSILETLAKQDGSFRVVAGNTGAGVYHDWPLERVLVDIKAIPELTKIKYSQLRK